MMRPFHTSSLHDEPLYLREQPLNMDSVALLKKVSFCLFNGLLYSQCTLLSGKVRKPVTFYSPCQNCQRAQDVAWGRLHRIYHQCLNKTCQPGHPITDPCMILATANPNWKMEKRISGVLAAAPTTFNAIAVWLILRCALNSGLLYLAF